MYLVGDVELLNQTKLHKHTNGHFERVDFGNGHIVEFIARKRKKNGLLMAQMSHIYIYKIL
jgi:hypothetical protein